MDDSLEQFLRDTQRDASYRVETVLKDTPFETTELVYLMDTTEGEQGPYIRKRINAPEGSSLGSAYQRIYDAQLQGRRFHRLPHMTNCFAAGNQTTVVMEYIQGETLLKARSQRQIDTRKTFDQICDAVRELHEKFNPPIIHRDLKPSNIMLSGNDVVLIDFGIARTFHKGTDADTTQFGTRSYAPPEQFGFSQTDERSDIYALGLLLFFLATGQEPTTADRVGRFSHPELDEQLRGIVNRATALDPDQRFSSVYDLQTAARIAFKSASAEKARKKLAGKAVSSTLDIPSWKQPLPDQRSFALKVCGQLQNIFAVGVFALAFIIFTLCTFDDSISAQTAIFPIWVRALLYGSFFFIPVACGCYAIADKTPLRRRIPFFLRIKGKRELVAVVLITFASFALFLFLVVLTTPMMPR